VRGQKQRPKEASNAGTSKTKTLAQGFFFGGKRKQIHKARVPGRYYIKDPAKNRRKERHAGLHDPGGRKFFYRKEMA